MAYIGGLGMRSFIVERAQVHCPAMLDALGPEAFASSMESILDQWVLSLFVGCSPARLLEHLWDHLLLPSPYHPADSRRRLPRGLATIIAFALAALKCCGEERLQNGKVLHQISQRRKAGAAPEDITLEAGEAIQTIRNSLANWPAEKDLELLGHLTRILVQLTQDEDGFFRLWEEVRKRKQRIADCAGNYDEQLMSLARRTHFTVQEIGRLREELRQLRDNDGSFGDNTEVSEEGTSLSRGLNLETFKELVRRAVPEFPLELCGRLFNKLDHFGVGRLTFVELACGMSALSLGTMDEKLQVCFDLFDSEGRRALTLKDLIDLCTTLFRVALAQGYGAARSATASTDEVLTPRRVKPPVHGRHVSARVRLADEPKPAEPWRSMLLRLLSAAQVRTPGGPLLVAFEDFRNAAHMEPALLCLFSWCLPRPPEISGPAFVSNRNRHYHLPGVQDSFWAFLCRRFCRLFGQS